MENYSTALAFPTDGLILLADRPPPRLPLKSGERIWYNQRMTPQEWDANGVPGKYAGTLDLLVELIVALNKTIYCAHEDEKLTMLPSVDRENLLTVRVRWPERTGMEWVISPKKLK